MHIRIQDTWTKSKWLLTELLMLIMTFCCAWGCTKWCKSRSHQCPNQIPELSQLDSFSAKEQRVLLQVSFRMSRLVTLFLRLSFYLWSHSLGHYPRPYEGRNVDQVVNRELRAFGLGSLFITCITADVTPISLHCSIVQRLLYKTLLYLNSFALVSESFSTQSTIFWISAMTWVFKPYMWLALVMALLVPRLVRRSSTFVWSGISQQWLDCHKVQCRH